MTSTLNVSKSLGKDEAGWRAAADASDIPENVAMYLRHAEKAKALNCRINWEGQPVEQSPTTRTLKAQEKPATVDNVAGEATPTSPPNSFAITEATPEISTSEGEASASSTKQEDHTPVHHNPNKTALVNQDTSVNFLLPNSSRRLSPVQHLKLAAYYKRRYEEYAALSRNTGLTDQQARDYNAIWQKHLAHKRASIVPEAQQESTPEAVEPVQPMPARHAAIDCGEVCLRAAIDAILDGNYDGLRDAFEEFQHSRIRYAGHGMNGLRTVYVSTIKRAVVKPEELIEVDENAGVAPGQLPLLPAGESEAA